LGFEEKKKMPDLNIFNLDFGNLIKLMNKGRIDKVYKKMWHVADSLSKKELEIFIYELPVKAKAKEIKTRYDILSSVINFKKDRMDFHMNEMKQLLEMSLKIQSEENNKKNKR